MIREKVTPIEEYLSCIQDFWNENSPIIDAPKYGGRPYENRPQQKIMSEAVANALLKNEQICIEAPTGVGKSFAYLIPAIFFAIHQPYPVIITTGTINLQEQLFEKDIPLLKKTLNIDFEVALAKGRGNYLCRRRLRMVTGEHQKEYLPNNSMLPEIAKIEIWANKTNEGSLSDLDLEPSLTLWQSICSEHGNCFGHQCQFFKECFYWRARKKWERSNILIANHALFLIDLKMKLEDSLEVGMLPQYSGIIIDEAHQLESDAAKHLGTRITKGSIFYFLNRLFNPDKARGLLIRSGDKAAELRKTIQTLFSQTNMFFSILETQLADIEETQKRIYTKNIVEDLMSEYLNQLAISLKDFSEEQDDQNYKMELNTQYQKTLAYKTAISEFLTQSAKDNVYWIEQETTTHKSDVSLNYSPLNIAKMLKAHLFSQQIPIILTSATLTVASNMKFYKERTGFDGKEVILDSPFDFSKQAIIHIPKNSPDITDENYHKKMAEQIVNYISKTSGKAFVLFTNYTSLTTIKEIIKDVVSKQNITLLVQGEGLSRTKMLNQFKKDINSVILGTTSFWSGVDVPGEALSNVIITKLPFSVPTEPIIEARLEKIKEKGGNPFNEYSLPEAVLKLKQGIGRLIRSKDDTGIIVILDNRILNKSYGKTFLKSLPPSPIIIE